ncbi:DUF7220 family protein [Marinicauda algicola]|uniref:DUF7220 family protein n=1 Tax=Marinicauda algicola TaxID=2029849 RepID=UPI0019D18DEE
MKQSRAMSLVESLANVAVGYGVAVVTQILIFPIFGLHTTLAQNLMMPTTRTPREGTKQAALIAMLRAPGGATVAEIVAATGWQPPQRPGV